MLRFYLCCPLVFKPVITTPCSLAVPAIKLWTLHSCNLLKSGCSLKTSPCCKHSSDMMFHWNLVKYFERNSKFFHDCDLADCLWYNRVKPEEEWRHIEVKQKSCDQFWVFDHGASLHLLDCCVWGIFEKLFEIYCYTNVMSKLISKSLGCVLMNNERGARIYCCLRS